MKENLTGTEVSTLGKSKAINWDTGYREMSSGEKNKDSGLDTGNLRFL